MTYTPRQIVVDTVILVIVLVWAASMIFEAFIPRYQTPMGTNEILMIVTGFLFYGLKGKSRNGNGA